MPPITFVGVTQGTKDGFDVLHHPVPAGAKPGDTLIFVVAGFNNDTLFIDETIAPQVDHIEGLFTSGDHNRWYVMRKIFEKTDPSEFTFAPVDPGNLIQCTLAYRDMANLPAIAFSGTDYNVAPQTNLVCPSRTMTHYSDMYFGIAGADFDTGITPPAGTTERFEFQVAGSRTLQVFDYLPEAVGATGTKTSTIVGAQLGGAASFAFAANGIRGWNKAIRMSPMGCIGLPTEGV